MTAQIPSHHKKISKRVSNLATAFHEAGHAVVGRVLTLVCGGATITADNESAGHCIIEEPYACISHWERRGKVRDAPYAAWHARIIAYMAGAEAESELLGSRAIGDDEDRRQIDLMAEEIYQPADWDRKERRLRAMTRMLVQRHRLRIERVAKALLTRKTLTAKQLDKLVGRSVDDVKVNAPLLLLMGKQKNKKQDSRRA
jgi:ATP-dependent Zn protease